MKRIFSAGIAGLVVFLLAGIAMAEAQSEESSFYQAQGESMKGKLMKPFIEGISESDLRQELSIREIYGRTICMELNKPCPLDGAKGAIEVNIKAAKVTEVATGMLSVSVLGIPFKVDIAQSDVIRYFRERSGIDEFVVGDIVNIFGVRNDADASLIHAKTVRNISLQKKITILKGVVGASSTIMAATDGSGSFELATEEYGLVKVSVSAQTKIMSEKQAECFRAPCPLFVTAVTLADLKQNMRAIVRGSFDKAARAIMASSVVLGNEMTPRPFFKKDVKELEKIVEKKEKAEQKLGKMEKKSEEATDVLRKKIESYQMSLGELIRKFNMLSGGGTMGGGTVTPTTSVATTTSTVQ